MNLLIDEDSQGKAVLRLLRDAGHSVVTAEEAGLHSRDDIDVLELAARENRVLLTRNVRDFDALHEANANHSGILVEHQDRDPSKNMRDTDLVRAVGNLERSGSNLTGQFVALNARAFLIEEQR